MLKTTIVILFAFLLPSILPNQQFSEKVDFFQIDVIGNMYLVKGAEIKKYDGQFKLQDTYSDLIFGEISSLDATDAMNILVYYQSFNKIIFLDNKLSIKGSPVDLTSLGYGEASLVCSSYNNSFWIFDPVGNQMLRFNKMLENTNSSGDLRSLVHLDLNPVQILEKDNFLLLRDNQFGVFVFDKYAGFLKQMPFKNLDDFYIYRSSWQMLRNDTNYIYHSRTQLIDTVPLPYQNVKEFRMSDNSYFVGFDDNSFQLFSREKIEKSHH